MAVDDHGLEVLKKSAEEVTPGNKSDYLIKTKTTNFSEILAKLSSDSATLSNVAGSASSVTLLSANTSRKGFVLYNDSNRDCYVKYGATASATSFTFLMGPNSRHIEAFPVYRGVIDGIWAAAAGSMRITELT